VRRTDKSNSVRKEIEIVTQVGNKLIRVIMRDAIVSFDPYLNLVKASAYPWLLARAGHSGKTYFPVPPVGRRIKDALIKAGVSI
jgi:hypothetical protein